MTQMTQQDWIALAAAIGQVSAALIAVGALIAALVQLREMRRQLSQDAIHNREAQTATERQLKDSREFAENQAKFFVVEFLERPENLALRRNANRLKTPRHNWPQDLQRDANLLSGMWEVVASLVDSSVVPESFVKELYGGAIVRQWELLKEHVADLRTTQGEPHQRRSFELLALRLKTQS